jgi:hypothetical protein
MFILGDLVTPDRRMLAIISGAEQRRRVFLTRGQRGGTHHWPEVHELVTLLGICTSAQLLQGVYMYHTRGSIDPLPASATYR